MARLRNIFAGLLIFALFLGSWEVLSRLYPDYRFVLPAPSSVAGVMWEHSGRLGIHTLATFKEMVGGFLIAFVAAFPLAWFMGSFRILRAVLQPAFIAIQCVPIFALAPLMVLWFGWSYAAIIAATALMVFFPLTMSIYQGLCATPRHLLDFFQVHQATPLQVFLKLQLPWALPHIFSGFRISVAIAGIGAVAGEWAGAQEGLGLLMLESRRGADVEMMFAALTCVTALSLALYGCVAYLQKIAQGRRQEKAPIYKVFPAMMVGLLLLAGCQDREKESISTKLVLDWLPNPNHVAIYAGIDKGFFKEEGINLNVLKVADPGDGIPYLTSGQTDIALSYMPHTINAISHGADIVPIGVLIGEPLNALIYRTGEGIGRPEDLNGKVIGYCVDGYHTAFLQAMLSERGIVPSEMRNVSFDLVSTLGTKQVDALYGAYWNIEGENLRQWGIDTGYFPLSDFGVPLYHELIFLVRGGSLQAGQPFATAFGKAMQRSIDYAVEHPEEVFEVYLKMNPDKTAKVRQWEREAWRKTIPVLAKNQDVDAYVWIDFVKWLDDRHLNDRAPYRASATR